MICDGCNVREPFEHRCHDQGFGESASCRCDECRGADAFMAERSEVDVRLVLDGAEGEADFEFADYIEGEGSVRYFRVGAGGEMDWGAVLLSVADAIQLRDWLTQVLHNEATSGVTDA